MADLLKLAERIEALDEIECPLCGDGGFDAPGFGVHVFNRCVVSGAIGVAETNADVAAALRARAGE